jgi:hypothetical protein
MERPLNDLAEDSDLFKKHHPPRYRPRSLREALREFARSRPFNDDGRRARKEG